MAMTHAEHQRRHRHKLALKGDHARINMTIPYERAIKLLRLCSLQHVPVPWIAHPRHSYGGYPTSLA